MGIAVKGLRDPPQILPGRCPWRSMVWWQCCVVAFDQIIIRRMQVLDDSNVSLDNETIAMETIYSYCIKQT